MVVDEEGVCIGAVGGGKGVWEGWERGGLGAGEVGRGGMGYLLGRTDMERGRVGMLREEGEGIHAGG